MVLLRIYFSYLIVVSCTASAMAQQYVSAINPVIPGKAPGMLVKLLDSAAEKRTYAIVFKEGDEVVSGMTDFATKFNIKSAHFKGIGDATSIKVGWFDYTRKQFKVIAIDTAEVTSLIGDIAIYEGKPAVHSHISAATSDGIVRGGHLLEILIGPTLEIIVTAEPVPMYKTYDSKFDAAFIDPTKD